MTQQPPSHLFPIGATEEYRTVVMAANYRCECTSQCGKKHPTDRFDEFPDRCDESMIEPIRPAKLFVWPTTVLGQPPVLTAVCSDCWDGLNRIKKRAARRRLLTPQSTALFTTTDPFNHGERED